MDTFVGTSADTFEGRFGGVFVGRPWPCPSFPYFFWILVHFKQGISLLILGFFPCVFQGFLGFGRGRSRKSLVNLRVFLDKKPQKQGKEGQGKGLKTWKINPHGCSRGGSYGRSHGRTRAPDFDFACNNIGGPILSVRLLCRSVKAATVTKNPKPYWADPRALWKKAPRAMRAMRGNVKLVLPSNESYESKTGCNRPLATVLWVPLTYVSHWGRGATVLRFLRFASPSGHPVKSPLDKCFNFKGA